MNSFQKAPLISVVVCSRVEGNENSNLIALLESIQTMTCDPSVIEILIKFDDDDNLALQNIDRLSEFDFTIKYCTGKRLRGYIDIHHGYCQAFEMASPTSIVVGALADDFTVIVKDWDKKILEHSHHFPDNIFFIHQREHPRYCNTDMMQRNTDVPLSFDGSTSESKCFLDWNFHQFPNLYIVDEAPFWGRAIIDATGGFGPVSFTDAWTLALEHILWNQHHINRTIFMEEGLIQRTTGEMDQPSNIRWDTDRASNFDYINSEEFSSIMEKEVQSILKYCLK